MASFEVRVLDAGQKPVGGARVRLEFIGLTRGMSAVQFTYTDGIAGFRDYQEGEIRVFVDGRDCGKHKYEDRKTITIMKQG